MKMSTMKDADGIAPIVPTATGQGKVIKGPFLSLVDKPRSGSLLSKLSGDKTALELS